MFLTNNVNTLPLYHWLQPNESICLYSEPISADLIKNLKPRLIISYNYTFLINSDCIEQMRDRIINLHISLLPWNRGSDPNFWSFIENTPKGVSVHLISTELDQGDIIFQEETKFDEEVETLRSSYEKLNVLIQELFKKNWDSVNEERYITFKQSGQGSYHTKSDYIKYLDKEIITFDEPIKHLKERICNK